MQKTIKPEIIESNQEQVNKYQNNLKPVKKINPGNNGNNTKKNNKPDNNLKQTSKLLQDNRIQISRYTKQEILSLVELYGFNPSELAKKSKYRITENVIKAWYQRDPDFRAAVERAEAEFVRNIVRKARNVVLESIEQEKDVKTALRILEIYDKANIAAIELQSEDKSISFVIKF